MAFLCPSSFKKKERYNRPTKDAYKANNAGDDVKEEISKQPQLFEVVEDYYPCSALELPVHAGEVVRYISSEGSWLFVRAENGSDGYIPRRHCRVIENMTLENNNISQNLSEISDVGYYSDHIDEKRMRQHSYRGSQLNLENVLHQRANEYASYDEPSGSSYSPASTISASSFQNMKIRSWSETTDGLYTRNSGELYRPESSPYVQRYSSYLNNAGHKVSQPEIKSNAPICGRKCQKGCSHNRGNKNETVDKQKQNNYEKTFNLQKSSVVSVESGNQVIEDEVDENMVTDKSENHRKISQQIKELIINETNKSLDQHKDLQNNLKQKREKIVLRTKRNTSKERCQSAPVGLIKTPCGHPELIVIKEYEKQAETDISVDRGDFASIINDTKYKDWIYITNEQGEKGFIPTKCVIKHDCQDHGCPSVDNLQTNEPKASRYSGDPTKYEIPDTTRMLKHVVIENYSGRNLDDLYVCVGDFVYINMRQQSIHEWFWVYSPKLKCSGYIPSSIVKDTRQSQQAKV